MERTETNMLVFHAWAAFYDIIIVKLYVMDVIVMVMSMTGYGIHTLRVEDTTVTAEIRSVNHRFLDVTTKLPHTLLFLEANIKKVVQTYFERGKIDVFIGIEGDGLVQKKIKTDWDSMDNYMEQINLAMDRYQLKGEIPPTIITSIPDIFSVQEITHESEGLKESIMKNVKLACEQVQTIRMEEGSFLIGDLKERIDTIYDIVEVLQKHRKHVQSAYRDRIQARVYDSLTDKDAIDHIRIHQEIVLLAEKGDITEEITRLFSHIEQMKQVINQTGVIGRKLDFITQEMHREANTIGSKSTDAYISEQAIALKSEIEKIKEQVQNIE